MHQYNSNYLKANYFMITFYGKIITEKGNPNELFSTFVKK